MAFGVCLSLVTLVRPLAQTVLYLHRYSSEAHPKVISERTRYLQVRLAFHRYPQVIQEIFNFQWFGPPQRFTVASACSWIDHLVSGLRPITKRPIQTRFRFGSSICLNLAINRNSPAHSSIGTLSLY
jgi:hypothetical protein